MKKSMVEYMNALTENKYEILEELIDNKYRKFYALYWMLREYSDNITELKYKDTSHDVLKIEVKLTKLDIDEVLKELQSNISKEDQILIWNEKKKIHIEITKDES